MTVLRDTTEEDTRSLVERARSDPEAVALLYRRYVARVHGFAFRRSGSVEVAEEITSATFERVVGGLASFHWRGGGFEPWLFRIAATETASWYRRARRADGARAQMAMRELALVGWAPAVDVVAEAATSDGGQLGAGDVMAALSRLRPRYQDAISLRYLAELTQAEAAAALGCSKSVFAVTLHRALAALRREVGRGGREPR